MTELVLPERRVLLPDAGYVIDDAKRRVMASIGYVLGAAGQVGRVLGQASAAPAGESYYAIVHNGSTAVNGGSAASLDDLPTGAFTADGWAALNKVYLYGELFYKQLWRNARHEGWAFSLNSMTQSGGIQYANFATVCRGVTQSQASTSTVNLGAPLVWHHYAMTLDAAGDAKVRIWIDGALVATAASALAGYYTDAGISFVLSPSTFWLGYVGWTRISNIVRYSAPFTPVAYNAPPATDANTLLLWRLTEGAGVTAGDSSSNGNNGTISNGSWIAL